MNLINNLRLTRYDPASTLDDSNTPYDLDLSMRKYTKPSNSSQRQKSHLFLKDPKIGGPTFGDDGKEFEMAEFIEWNIYLPLCL